MIAAPTNPFDLGSHLINAHHQHPDYIDPLDADTLRQYHLQCHDTGMPDHQHEEH